MERATTNSDTTATMAPISVIDRTILIALLAAITRGQTEDALPPNILIELNTLAEQAGLAAGEQALEKTKSALERLSQTRIQLQAGERFLNSPVLDLVRFPDDATASITVGPALRFLATAFRLPGHAMVERFQTGQ